eukprot:Platyproteum_vivax@DN3599_c0_g1_i1.p2
MFAQGSTANPHIEVSTNLKCHTCGVSFLDFAARRNHYDSEWHKFNLKRRTQECAPIDEEVLNQKVLEIQTAAAVPKKGQAHIKNIKKKESKKEKNLNQNSNLQDPEESAEKTERKDENEATAQIQTENEVSNEEKNR